LLVDNCASCPCKNGGSCQNFVGQYVNRVFFSKTNEIYLKFGIFFNYLFHSSHVNAWHHTLDPNAPI
jgi:hypothetical protein